MNVPQSCKYRHAMLRTVDGDYYVTVPEGTPTDEHGFILRPKEVFAVGSVVVAVERATEKGIYESPANPHVPGGQDEVEFVGHVPRHGAFFITFLPDGRVAFKGHAPNTWTIT